MFNQSKHQNKKHLCMFCLQCFSSESILAKHTNNCLRMNGKQAINMPKKGENILKFDNFHKKLPVPFVISADFEATQFGTQVKFRWSRDRNDRTAENAFFPCWFFSEMELEPAAG